jgi:transcriptional regulator with XRE-family HTH domain
MGGWQSILGRAVRERRQELELTLDEASRAIGISRSHLNLIELGKATGVSGEAVARIDAGLGAQGALVPLLPPKDAADVIGVRTCDGRSSTRPWSRWLPRCSSTVSG